MAKKAKNARDATNHGATVGFESKVWAAADDNEGFWRWLTDTSDYMSVDEMQRAGRRRRTGTRPGGSSTSTPGSSRPPITPAVFRSSARP
jgi:hypothetical protein